MTVSMGVAVLLNLAALGVLAGLPGWLLYDSVLRRLGLSWRVSGALVLAFLSVLFSDLASVFGYRLSLMLFVSIGGIVLMVAIWWFARRRRLREASNVEEDPSALSQLFILGVYLAPAFVLFLSLDTDAQGFGYLALMVREGGTINTLAPWHPEVRYLYSPALFVWWAYLSDLFKLPLHQVMLPFSHIMAGMVALLGIDLAKALLPQSPRARWLYPLMIVFGLGLFFTLMDSAYTSVFGFLFVALFLVLAFWSLRFDQWWPSLLAALGLAAVALTHPDTILILLIGYIPFYATFWLSRGEYRTRTNWLRLFVIIPALGVILTIPWLLRVWPLFFEAHVVSPFALSLNHTTQLILFQGVLVPLLALIGIILVLSRRSLPDVLMVTWVVFLIDFSLFGVVDSLLQITGFDVMRYIYPFSVAWHGPILSYAYLAAVAVDALMNRFHLGVPFQKLPSLRGRRVGDQWETRELPASKSVTIGRSSPLLPVIGLFFLILSVILSNPVLTLTRPLLQFFGAFSSKADIAAMTYIRENTPPDSIVLNYPIGFEGHWVPVIAERDTIALRDQPFFSGAQPLYDRTTSLRDVYFDLARVDSRDRLRAAGISYIIIPQIVTQPERFDGEIISIMRWRWPGDTWQPLQSQPADQNWLELVFEQDGAQVWRIQP